MSSRPKVRRLALAALALGLSVGLAGCESMDALNPFAQKEKKLPGTRVPVFPEGVPGVDYNAAPPQPANSAIPDYPAPSAEGAAAPAASGAASGTVSRGTVTTQ